MSDVIVVGGGAAGLMCAIRAARRGRRVTVLERAAKPGRKILISGGGRCNFTNLNASPEHYLSENPRFCVSALQRYTPPEFVETVEAHSIAYHEKELGQLFCDRSSQQIVDMLLAECRDAGADVRVACNITSVEARPGGYALATSLGEFACDALVMASGGLSIPAMGATSFSHDVARQFGMRVTDTRAALVPFTFDRPRLDFFSGLSGVAVPCTVSRDGASFTHNLLCTHRGLSGPAMLQISSYWREGQAIEIDLLPGVDAEAMLREARRTRPRAALATVLADRLPRRFAQAFGEAFLPAKPVGQLSRTEMADSVETIKRWRVVPDGTEGYRTAEVTLGGIDTQELSSKTMESRRAPGLFFIGECVDVTGHLGGYNFQWAWASGYCAGEYV